jgi:hypothetical protein
MYHVRPVTAVLLGVVSLAWLAGLTVFATNSALGQSLFHEQVDVPREWTPFMRPEPVYRREWRFQWVPFGVLAAGGVGAVLLIGLIQSRPRHSHGLQRPAERPFHRTGPLPDAGPRWRDRKSAGPRPSAGDTPTPAGQATPIARGRGERGGPE